MGDPPESYKKKPADTKAAPDAKPALVYTDAPKAESVADAPKKKS